MKRKKKKVNLFLDSGAYSAFSQGTKIDLDEYIEFIKKFEHAIDQYSNLDVIPVGDITKAEAAQKTLENQRKMEAAGLTPIPVFHYREPVKYLEHYVQNYDYISLGGMVPVSNRDLVPWLNKLWQDHLTDDDMMPRVKVHGFGMTSLDLMLRYPWFSVDSTSWVVTGRLGAIFVPRWRDGGWVYDDNAWKISVSNQSPDKKERGKHIDTLPPATKKVIMKYIHEKGYQLGESEFVMKPLDYEPAENEKWAQNKKDVIGDQRKLEIIKEPGVSNMYQKRDEMNLIFFQDLEDSMPDWPSKYEPRTKLNKPMF